MTDRECLGVIAPGNLWAPDSQDEVLIATAKIASIRPDNRSVMTTPKLSKTLKCHFATTHIKSDQKPEWVQVPEILSYECILFPELPWTELQSGDNDSMLLSISDKLSAALGGLSVGDSVTIQTRLSPEQHFTWNCATSKEHQLNGSWTHKHYALTGYLRDYTRDVVEGWPGIFLTQPEMSSLGITKWLRPLCGWEMCNRISEPHQHLRRHHRPYGCVQVFFQGKLIERTVVVYSHDLLRNVHQCNTSGVFITESLFRKLPGAGLGSLICVCSRYDVTTPNESPKDHPTLNKDDDLAPRQDYVSLLRGHSAKELLTMIRQEKDRVNLTREERKVILEMLQDWQRNAAKWLGLPECLQKIAVVGNRLPRVEESYDFVQFLGHLGKHHESLVLQHQYQYHALLLKELEEGKLSAGENPPLLTALFRMGVNVKNERGENLLHVMFRLGKGNIEAPSYGYGYLEDPMFPVWMAEPEPHRGRTPFHYICLYGRWENLIFLNHEDVMKQLNIPLIGDRSRLGTPMLSLLQEPHSKERCVDKFMTLKKLIQMVGVNTCLQWIKQDSVYYSFEKSNGQPDPKDDDHALLTEIIVTATIVAGCLPGEDKPGTTKEKEESVSDGHIRELFITLVEECKTPASELDKFDLAVRSFLNNQPEEQESQSDDESTADSTESSEEEEEDVTGDLNSSSNDNRMEIKI